MKPKMYVLTRLDLDPRYRIVQGSHALAQYAIDHTEKFEEWNNETIIYLGVRFHRGIEEWAKRIEAAGEKQSVFSEPDQNFQCTAIACYTTGEIFKDLPLA